MNPIARRKFFQRIKGFSHDKFWAQMNIIHTYAYNRAEQHLLEAMSCTPGITKKQIEAVKAKATEIRETWDGMPDIEAESSIDEMMREVRENADNGPKS